MTCHAAHSGPAPGADRLAGLGTDPEADYREQTDLSLRAADTLAQLTGIARHDVAVVLGSGWQPAADQLVGDPGTEQSRVDMDQIPGLHVPGASGHSRRIQSVEIARHRVLVFLGRTHLYEGHGVGAVAHGVRTAVAAGCRSVFLTNAAGGLNPGYAVGQPVLVRDHLNFTGRSPLVGPEFVDLTRLYSPRLRELAQNVDPTLADGVYAAMPGPHFETPAEIRMLATLGADLVGMSTVLESIAAHAAGAEVCALSMVTNLAAGITAEPLAHEEVLRAGQASADRLGGLLRALIAKL